MNKRIKQILVEVITGIISFSLVGCDKNDSEIEYLQKQITKLEQQIEESEVLLEECTICGESNTCTESKCINSDKKVHCAVCDKEDSIKNMTWRKESALPEGDNILYQHESCLQEKLEEIKETIPCEWCGEHTTDYITWKDKVNEDHHTHNGDCTDNLKAEFEKQYEIIEEAKDPTYICDICGCVGICTPYKCINPDKIPEYAGCRSCGISIMYSEDYYELGGTPLCRECHDRIKAEAPYGYCIYGCGTPVNQYGICPNCSGY